MDEELLIKIIFWSSLIILAIFIINLLRCKMRNKYEMETELRNEHNEP